MTYYNNKVASVNILNFNFIWIGISPFSIRILGCPTVHKFHIPILRARLMVAPVAGKIKSSWTQYLMCSALGRAWPSVESSMDNDVQPIESRRVLFACSLPAYAESPISLSLALSFLHAIFHQLPTHHNTCSKSVFLLQSRIPEQRRVFEIPIYMRRAAPSPLVGDGDDPARRRVRKSQLR